MTCDAVEVRASAGGTVLRVRVKPGARRTRLIGPYGGALKLEVAAAPEKGRANRAVEALVAKQFGLPAASVQVLAGETCQDKVLTIAVEPAVLVATLRRLGIDAAQI